jgi:hypothetical protein
MSSDFLKKKKMMMHHHLSLIVKLGQKRLGAILICRGSGWAVSKEE